MSSRPAMADSSTASAASNNPSAKFLQARISALSRALINRLENILSVSLDDEDNPVPSLTDTAAAQLQVDLETQGLIKAAQEVMLLTRSLKEIWLFGGLNTVKEGEERLQAERESEELQDEKARVDKQLQEWVNKGTWIEDQAEDDRNSAG